MKIIIGGEFEFPDGGAATARIRNVASALAELGHEVHLLPLSLPLKIGSDVTRVVQYGSNQFYTVLPSPSVQEIYAVQGSLRGKIRWFKATNLRATRFADWLKSSGIRADILFVYGRSYMRLRKLQLWALKMGVASVLDITEGSERFDGFGGVMSPIYWDWRIGAKYLVSNSELISAISTGLGARARARGARRVVLLPPIESWRDLPAVGHKDVRKKPRIVVFGALTKKDAPQLLTEVIRSLAKNNVEVCFELVGRYKQDRTSAEWARRMCDLDNGITTVISRGALGNDDLVVTLGSADGFLLLRPDTVAEQLAFPTRIVELLKYGRPLFLSDVGDVGLYLKDGVHAFLLPPGNPTAIASRLRAIKDAAVVCAKVGEAGRIQGASCFDRVQCMKRVLAGLMHGAE
jgi:glycosyltransferase involved in cell wall biosynthesis